MQQILKFPAHCHIDRHKHNTHRRSRLSSAGGSCGRQTAGHSSCRTQVPRSVGGTLPWLVRPLGTASLSTFGLHQCPEIHLRKNSKLIYLAVSALEVFSNLALYKLTYSFIHVMNADCTAEHAQTRLVMQQVFKLTTHCHTNTPTLTSMKLRTRNLHSTHGE